MDLKLKGQYFLVTGAGSGFGRAIAEALIKEGAFVFANSRTEEKLIELKNMAPDQVEYLAVDITIPLEQDKVLNMIGNKRLSGAVINAGGPPTKSAMESRLNDWDTAYKSLVRWKVRITKKLVQRFIGWGGGRMVFVESISTKQPIDNLVLSNAFRLAIVGYVKTFAKEVGSKGVNMNILAPGYHDTNAMERVIARKALTMDVSKEEAREHLESETLMGKMGNPEDFASLALWLLSPQSAYVTGQTISVDGGLAAGVFG